MAEFTEKVLGELSDIKTEVALTRNQMTTKFGHLEAQFDDLKASMRDLSEENKTVATRLAVLEEYKNATQDHLKERQRLDEAAHAALRKSIDDNTLAVTSLGKTSSANNARMAIIMGAVAALVSGLVSVGMKLFGG